MFGLTLSVPTEGVIGRLRDYLMPKLPILALCVAAMSLVTSCRKYEKLPSEQTVGTDHYFADPLTIFAYTPGLDLAVPLSLKDGAVIAVSCFQANSQQMLWSVSEGPAPAPDEEVGVVGPVEQRHGLLLKNLNLGPMGFAMVLKGEPDALISCGGVTCVLEQTIRSNHLHVLFPAATEDWSNVVRYALSTDARLRRPLNHEAEVLSARGCTA